MDFRTKRQFAVIAVVALVVVMPIAVFIYTKLPQATCFDSRRNQGEEKVDCGGPCVPCVLKHPQDVSVFWARFVALGQDSYDAAAEVRNPNIKLGAKEFEYEFQLFDDAGVIVARRVGRSFIFPGQTVHLIEANIKTMRVVSRVSLVVREIQWVFTDIIQPDVAIGDRKLTATTDSGGAILTATLLNRSLSDFDEVVISALILDEQGNMLAVSKTVEKNVRAGEGRRIFFSWPSVLPHENPSVIIEPKVNILK